MPVGTIETTIETEKKLKRRSGLRSGGSNNGGKNRGGGGGGGSGGNHSNKENFQELEPFKPNKSKILTWFLLSVVVMTFGVLIGAYIVISTNKAIEWQPFKLPVQVWISTFLILTGSLTFMLAQKGIYAGNQPKAKKWLLATTILGAAFISSQLLAWLELVNRGVYVQSNPYAGFFYILTAVHAVHVIGGIVALGAVVLKTWYLDNSSEGTQRRETLTQVVGWYWHFMGGLWLVLLMLLSFWK
ncbi:MAG: cytochrome c oxidase subunit 3 [Acidobacteriota bacterium]|nr:cytochrome c oxidase subunit 3 [Acidobacteriota bacterium]